MRRGQPKGKLSRTLGQAFLKRLPKWPTNIRKCAQSYYSSWTPNLKHKKIAQQSTKVCGKRKQTKIPTGLWASKHVEE